MLALTLLLPPASDASGTSAAAAAAASESKAAFLYNFAKFTEWPSDAILANQQLSICVAGDNSVAAALQPLVAGKAIGGHEVVIVIVNVERPIDWCHVLYVDGLDAPKTAQLFETLKGIPVLTVGNSGTFVKRGGIVQLLLDKDRMRFLINVEAARRARLTLSSNLLNLATIVKDGSDVDH
jgi:hypothetical protein